MEEANAELEFWFVDTEPFATFADNLKSLLNVVVREAVPLKLVDGEGAPLVLDESVGAAGLPGIFFHCCCRGCQSTGRSFERTRTALRESTGGAQTLN